MKAAVLQFPGSNCDRDMAVALEQAGADVTIVWHKEAALPKVDLVAVPGGFLTVTTCVAAPSLRNRRSASRWSSM